ncbi:nucleotidyltransferase family protein [Halomonas sp. E19]|uniref:nucleotidyltransferase family protein n=1 Tax=Halomonas sp. E19 TaxID=3397247 RepID=UPI0040344898
MTTNASPIANDRVLQLLIMLSRIELSDEQKEQALSLCRDVTDWAGVALRARQNLILPLVYRHLRQLQPAGLEARELEQMRIAVMTIQQRSMLVMSAQQAVLKDLIEPLGIPAMFFKGPSLAMRYYDEPAIRISRDIDVLVPHNAMVRLLETALQLGYVPYDPQPLQADPSSLAFLARTQKVITLISPLGVGIEFHQRIVRYASVYDTEDLLTRRDALQLDPLSYPVMPTDELFVYICLHHTKHFWSHLHWLVDLDAIQRHPDFCLESVRRCAERHDLVATVEASLELYRAMSQPCPWEYEPISAQGRELLTSSLAAMAGGSRSSTRCRRRWPHRISPLPGRPPLPICCAGSCSAGCASSAPATWITTTGHCLPTGSGCIAPFGPCANFSGVTHCFATPSHHDPRALP